MFIEVNQSTIKVSVTHVYGMFHRLIRCAFRSLTAHHVYLSHIRYAALTEYNLKVRYDIDASHLTGVSVRPQTHEGHSVAIAQRDGVTLCAQRRWNHDR